MVKLAKRKRIRFMLHPKVMLNTYKLICKVLSLLPSFAYTIGSCIQWRVLVSTAPNFT